MERKTFEARSSSSYSPKNWRPTIDIDFTRKEIEILDIYLEQKNEYIR